MTSVSLAEPVRTPVRTARLLALGAAAGPLYVAVSLAEASGRAGFDPTRHAWSQLANGDLGWIHVANLIVSGLLVAAGAVGLGRTLGTGGRRVAWLLAGYGLGMVAAGIFRADPGRGFPAGTPEVVPVSWHGMLHFAAGGVGFVCFGAACLLLARRLRRAGRRGLAAFSTVTGVLFLAAFAAMAAGGGASWGIVAFTGAVILASGWLCAVMIYFAGTAEA
jgi:hypothetical membrane protein